MLSTIVIGQLSRSESINKLREATRPTLPIIPQSHRWFAVRVKSNFERLTALHLGQRGYDSFLPTYTTRTRWSDRLKNIVRPLFPGYVFCGFDPAFRLPILTTPGVVQIVGIGKEPVPVDNAELESVWKALQSGLAVHPWPFLQLGERVVVEHGPLVGIEGKVIQFKSSYRLVVSIHLLQRSVAAEIERAWIRPVYSQGSSERSAARV